MGTHERLNQLLEEHYNHTNSISVQILQEIKSISRNYKELESNLEMFKKGTLTEYRAVQKYRGLFAEIELMLEDEMGNLPLAISNKFKAGDRVVVRAGVNSYYKSRIGVVVRIDDSGKKPLYIVNITSSDLNLAFDEHELQFF